MMNWAETEWDVDFDRDLIVKYDGKGPRYTSYPTADRFSKNILGNDISVWFSQHKEQIGATPVSLYFHLPFCDTLCFYCACNKIITRRRDKADSYLAHLEMEVKQQTALLGKRPDVSQLHLGGGTPTFLTDRQLAQFMTIINTHFNLLPSCEASIEVDPRRVSAQTVALLGQLGFNRMSIGVQDVNPVVQKAVNRIQPIEEVVRVLEAGRANGFRSFNMDLIYGLPFQTAESVAQTIDIVAGLAPERLAFYNYAHLPGRFMPQRRILEQDLPSPEEKLDILQNSVQQLLGYGYLYIGMDHFALPEDDLAKALVNGRMHRNFQGYSTHADCDMLAFGVSSIAKIGRLYAQNVKTLDSYYAALQEGLLPVERGLFLSDDDVVRREVIQHLMCRFGLDFTAMGKALGIDFCAYFAPELARLQDFAADGLVLLRPDALQVTAKGRFLIRAIAMVFDHYLHTQTPVTRYSRLI